MRRPILAAALLAAARAGAQTLPVRVLPLPSSAASARAAVSTLPPLPSFAGLPAAAPSSALPLPAAAPAALPLLAAPSSPSSPPRASAPAPKAASPASVARSLLSSSGAWDGRRARAAARETAVLAAPYRTERQLARLDAAPRKEGETFRFAVIGDAEPGRFWFSRALFNKDPGAFWTLLSRADGLGHDFIVQLGDMVSRGVPRRFLRFFRGLHAAAVRSPYLTVIGNHDRHKPHGVTHDRVYRSLFGATDYSFQRAGWRFVVVDNSAGRLTRDQLAWLDRTLDADRPTVVFTHMPPSPLGEWTDFGRKGSGGFRQGAAEFMSLMSERRVARVYMGHVHAFGVLDRDGVRYVLTGGGGSPLFPGPVKDRFHHSLSVSVGPEGLTETVHPLHGAPFPLR